MRALFDVNVLIALLHREHAFHQAAHLWWDANQQHGWASCPLTENGVVRIMSNPGYSGLRTFSVSDVSSFIRNFAQNTDHKFWPDSISINDHRIFATAKILGPRQLTDVYLVGLATQNDGIVVTFDKSISRVAVKSASPKHLVVI